MRTAYDLLLIDQNADDHTIKQAYLERVHHFSPEHDPVNFQRVRDAYEKIKTARMRARYRLFEEPEVDLMQILADQLETKAPERPSADLLLKMLQESSTW